MWVERPKVRAVVEAAVEEIEAAGVKPTVSDILWLAHVADRNCQPNKSDPLDDFELPVRCGQAKLYRLTIAGDIWLRECASSWWGPRSIMSRLAELYALAHGKDSKVMAELWDRKTARKKITAWAVLNLPVSAAHIKRALYIVSGGTEYVRVKDATGRIVKAKAQEEVSPFDWGEEVACLCAVYKRDPKYFLFEISANQAKRMMRKAAFAMGRPDLANDSEADKDDGFGRWRLIVNDIIDKGKERAAVNG